MIISLSGWVDDYITRGIAVFFASSFPPLMFCLPSALLIFGKATYNGSAHLRCLV